MTRTETINTTVKPFEVSGHYFELLKTINPVNVRAYDKNGHNVANEQGVESGFYIDRRGLSGFERVEIETTGNESVTFLYSDGTTGTKRPNINWYDRNGIGRGQEFDNAGLAPLATTTQWTYTAPAGKKFNAQALAVHCLRATQSTNAGQAGCRISYTPSGGAATKVIYAPLLTNTVGAGQAISVGGALTLMPGDALACIVFDLSADGTTWMFGGMQGIEFNA